jgi:outer membrane murein-binding lipoprotein Lpp
VHPSPPQYLYLLNSNGIPLFPFNNRFSASTSVADSTSQRQLDTLTSQLESVSATVHALSDDQKILSHSFQTAQDNITRAFADSTAIYAATNLVTAAQSELTSLQSSLTTLQLMSVLAPTPQAQQAVQDNVTTLQARINAASTTRDSRAAELYALQSRALPMLPSSQVPSLTMSDDVTHNRNPSVPSAAPSPAQTPVSAASSSHKRMRTTDDDGEDTLEDAQDTEKIAAMMEVDTSPKVRLQPSLQNFPLSLSHPFVHPSSNLTAPRTPILMGAPPCAAEMYQTRGLIIYAPSNFHYSCTCASSFKFSLIPRLHLSLLFITLLSFLLLPVTYALPSGGPVFLRTISLNANGLADPMKLAAIQGMVRLSQPHAIVIGETKSSEPVSSRLGLQEYDFHENPGRPLNARNKGKWGVTIGIRRGLFNVQAVATAATLCGRAVTLDLTIPTTNNLGFNHRLVGVYAPWNPGGTEDDEHAFWPEITMLCNSAKFSWSLHGDLNATLLASESSSDTHDISPSRLAYTHFLQNTDAIDLWRSQPENDISHNYTHRTRGSLANSTSITCSIIDRSAVSRIGTLAGTISTFSHFIPCTDHRPIDTRITLVPPSTLSGTSNIPQEVPPTSYSPRFRHPFCSEKYWFSHFTHEIDNLLSHQPPAILNANILSDDDFLTCYDAFTDILLGAARSSFILPSPWNHVQKIINPTITLLLRELRRINHLLGAMSRSHDLFPIQFPNEPWVQQYIIAFLSTTTITLSSSLFRCEFKKFLATIRKKLHKI